MLELSLAKALLENEPPKGDPKRRKWIQVVIHIQSLLIEAGFNDAEFRKGLFGEEANEHFPSHPIVATLHPHGSR